VIEGGGRSFSNVGAPAKVVEQNFVKMYSLFPSCGA
jgi:hypothetical protein